MYYIRLKLKNSPSQNIYIFNFTQGVDYHKYLSNNIYLRSSEIRVIKGNSCFVKFSQVYNKLIVFSYKYNNDIIHKQYYINGKNYKNKHLINLDDCDFFNDINICNYIRKCINTT